MSLTNIGRIGLFSVPRSPKTADLSDAVKRNFSFLESSFAASFRGKKVLIKPNMMGTNPRTKSITTNPSLVYETAALILECGAANVMVGDGSYVGAPDTIRNFLLSGYAFSRESLIDFNDPALPHMDLMNTGGLSALRSFSVPAALRDFDVFVNMPVIKTHFSMGMSCALKNLIGLLPVDYKRIFHFAGLAPSIADLNHSLTDFFVKNGKQSFILVDGITAMEGEGPGAGDDRSLGITLSAMDAIAVDFFVAKRVLGLDPEQVPYLKIALQRAGSYIQAEDLSVEGDTFVRGAPFALPSAFTGIPSDASCLDIFGRNACCGCFGTLQAIQHRLAGLTRPGKKLTVLSGKPDGTEIKGPDVLFGNCAVRHVRNGRQEPYKGAVLTGCPPIMAEGVSKIRLLEIEKLAKELSRRVHHIENLVRELWASRFDKRDTAALVAERTKRADEGFAIINASSALLAELTKMSPCQKAKELIELLTDINRKAFRYNRESPVFLENTPVAVIPAGYNRNFLRDNTEHMYFLSLHGLPTAYDLFCCTFVDTPQGYLQELHFHKRSEEVTLLLDGSSDCTWYREEPSADGKKQYIEAGRFTAGRFEAFRIPTGVVHSIHNPSRPNSNITVKLSMFIEDRVARNMPEFEPFPKELAPVKLDKGEASEFPWGSSILFRHSFMGRDFSYRIDRLFPGKVFVPDTGRERFYFTFSGGIEVLSPDPARIPVSARNILRIAKGLEVRLSNPFKEEAVLFSVEGLDHSRFLEHPDEFPEYPDWLKAGIQLTCSGAPK